MLAPAVWAQTAGPGAAAPASQGAAATQMLQGGGVFGGLSSVGRIWKKAGVPIPHWVPGASVTYAAAGEAEKPSVVRYAVIPEPGLPGPEYRVIEVRVTSPLGETTVLKALVRGTRVDAFEPVALAVKLPGMPVLPLPLSAATAERTGATGVKATRQKAREPMRVEVVGDEEVESAVGRVRARHLRVWTRDKEGAAATPTDVWIDLDGKVPLFGFVKTRRGGDVAKIQSVERRGALSDLPTFSRLSPEILPTPVRSPARASGAKGSGPAEASKEGAAPPAPGSAR